MEHYIRGVSAYVLNEGRLGKGQKKAAQIRLSGALARVLAEDLTTRLPRLKGRLKIGESNVAGGLRPVKADLSEPHHMDGLRLAVELKPINIAVGRALWNRFGDIRTFAVNIHLKFPFAVVGGVLVIPTYELVSPRTAELTEDENAGMFRDDSEEESGEEPVPPLPGLPGVRRKPTRALIERAIARLVRAGGRKSEAEAAHLLEAIGVIIYDPDRAAIDTEILKPDQGLTWGEFVEDLAAAYDGRFEK